MEWLMKKVAEQLKKDLNRSDMTDCMISGRLVEELVGKMKWKGQWSRTVIKMSTDHVDLIPQKHSDSADEEVPHLVFTNSLEEVGDNIKNFGQTSNIFDAMMLLIATYYVFDLEYPTIYSQVLGIT
ncbi:uncharacterized protein LOC111085258 [Limulus polyphemus]|uniref:Uncharacterized protein LOC111085258 n=1 Tax=Limulus polyphemus TaxID=6850 RepID=A0ABM1S4Y0_LIMPO|nr:uncharacterized protein LOC111085258 [Limulus polyphemus]XP_022238685.1 uncharacterized protein LOC111085258 [Limulus polyphemus]